MCNLDNVVHYRGWLNIRVYFVVVLLRPPALNCEPGDCGCDLCTVTWNWKCIWFPKRGASGDGHVAREPLNPRCGSGDVKRSSNHGSELCYCMLCTVAKIEVLSEKELSRYFEVLWHFALFAICRSSSPPCEILWTSSSGSPKKTLLWKPLLARLRGFRSWSMIEQKRITDWSRSFGGGWGQIHFSQLGTGGMYLLMAG